MDTDCAQLVANTFIHNMWTIPTFSVNLNRNTFETMFGNNGEASLGWSNINLINNILFKYTDVLFVHFQA